jgi:hypothetical protein
MPARQQDTSFTYDLVPGEGEKSPLRVPCGCAIQERTNVSPGDSLIGRSEEKAPGVNTIFSVGYYDTLSNMGDT